MADKRTRLTREQVLAAGVELADAVGIDGVTMRKLGQALCVEAMSLYHHVANKEQLLDGMTDLVYTEIQLPQDTDWRTAMQVRAHSLRDTLNRHPWALRLVGSRTSPGDATVRHHDAVLGTLRRAGFPLALAAHAFSVLDAYIYGFAVQEQALPFDSEEAPTELATAILAQFPTNQYPYLAELTARYAEDTGYAYVQEFTFGLDLILDGLERALAVGAPPYTPARE
ncbi:TetR/AcrR family transcriptional regulator [Actinokineospora globicatena]|uniref:TetR/AcrR family transcriptional regulator n=1 Tax=Actinokineospora globicatena TaxID=103729 RepID=UPI0020A2FEA3|nr:TetR/AcrR family transcriptional regulator [Actinokineospora globicatena]MCP2303368.1 transcriptional regulator, TetR family [Actinokineospora globicatena]GLW79498.1 TetR family transcriptional regulator [Actinokineospora globicatena]GLW86092.1 TetR family transcriptional regulator [Actinokineospora globicatena]